MTVRDMFVISIHLETLMTTSHTLGDKNDYLFKNCALLLICPYVFLIGSFGVELQVVLLNSLLNGKIFVEWICPAVAQAYLFYVSIFYN